MNFTLEEIGNFLAKFTEHSEHIYWISSADFKKIQYISPSYERIWGRSREELYSNPEIWITFLHPEDIINHHPIHEMAKRVELLGERARYAENYRIIRPDGNIRWIMDNGFPIFDESGRCLGVTGIAIDITNEKVAETSLKHAKEIAESALQSLQQSQAEEQKQRKEAERLEIENAKHKAALEIAQISAEKEQEMRKTVMVLVGDIVHDLRTPIAIIEDGADILGSISFGLSKVIKEAFELKSEALSSLNTGKLNYVINDMSIAQKNSVRMINDFIDTTLRELSVAQKYQDGAIAREDLTQCSSRRILENVLDSYPRRANIKINECFAYDFFLMGNSILMMKVLFNLIRNAEEQIIAHSKGEITITTKETEENNLLIIKDTAGGAPPEVLDNLFKEFFTTKKEGSGIGLVFCKKMIHNFGGDLTYNSVLGESMEFILSFPKIAISKSIKG